MAFNALRNQARSGNGELFGDIARNERHGRRRSSRPPVVSIIDASAQLFCGKHIGGPDGIHKISFFNPRVACVRTPRHRLKWLA
jgi:hypothetical protein